MEQCMKLGKSRKEKDIIKFMMFIFSKIQSDNLYPSWPALLLYLKDVLISAVSTTSAMFDLAKMLEVLFDQSDLEERSDWKESEAIFFLFRISIVELWKNASSELVESLFQ
jgi:hypothetical protein